MAAQMPPALAGAPAMGASAMQPPTGNPGEAANAMSVVREALNLLNQSLSKIPVGSEVYRAIAGSIDKLGKHISPSDEVPGVQKNTIANMGRDAQQSAQMQALLRSLSSSPPGGAGSTSGGGAGSPPGPGAASAAMPPALAA